MTDKHPYITSAGPIIQTIKHLRNSFPSTLDANTLKKLGLAPKNEGYLISILRFIGVINEEGVQTEDAKKVFSQHSDEAFEKGFAELVKHAYNDLFDSYGDKAWDLGNDELITFFRASDHTSGIVGKRQAATFSALSALSGHKEMPSIKGVSNGATSKKKAVAKKKTTSAAKTKKDTQTSTMVNASSNGRDVGLTVRVEINLPSDGDQDTYDRIFRSIKENLLNGE